MRPPLRLSPPLWRLVRAWPGRRHRRWRKRAVESEEGDARRVQRRRPRETCSGTLRPPLSQATAGRRSDPRGGRKGQGEG